MHGKVNCERFNKQRINFFNSVKVFDNKQKRTCHQELTMGHAIQAHFQKAIEEMIETENDRSAANQFANRSIYHGHAQHPNNLVN